jgi:hypothetical protein
LVSDFFTDIYGSGIHQLAGLPALYELAGVWKMSFVLYPYLLKTLNNRTMKKIATLFSLLISFAHNLSDWRKRKISFTFLILLPPLFTISIFACAQSSEWSHHWSWVTGYGTCNN